MVIAHKDAKRKRDGKETEVRISGEVVSVKKLRKEASRYGYDAAFSHGFEGNQDILRSPNSPYRMLILSQRQTQRHPKESTSVPLQLCRAIRHCYIISLGSDS